MSSLIDSKRTPRRHLHSLEVKNILSQVPQSTSSYRPPLDSSLAKYTVLNSLEKFRQSHESVRHSSSDLKLESARDDTLQDLTAKRLSSEKKAFEKARSHTAASIGPQSGRVALIAFNLGVPKLHRDPGVGKTISFAAAEKPKHSNWAPTTRKLSSNITSLREKYLDNARQLDFQRMKEQLRTTKTTSILSPSPSFKSDLKLVSLGRRKSEAQPSWVSSILYH